MSQWLGTSLIFCHTAIMSTVQPRKRFGQHFLRDTTVIDHLLMAIAPQRGQQIVEIGPGLGAMTTALLPLVGKMDAVELDRDLVPKLSTLCQPLGQLSIHQADALQFDFSSLAQQQKIRVIGNLPYNISTPLLFHLFSSAEAIVDMHFMLQQEVVDRLAATPNSRNYGRLAVMAQYYCQVEKLFSVPPQAFHPPPKVNSAVVRLTPHPPPLKALSTEQLSQTVRIAFQQQRKTIHNNLKSLLDDKSLRQLAIDPSLRPRSLTVNDCVKLSNFLYQQQEKS